MQEQEMQTIQCPNGDKMTESEPDEIYTPEILNEPIETVTDARICPMCGNDDVSSAQWSYKYELCKPCMYKHRKILESESI